MYDISVINEGVPDIDNGPTSAGFTHWERLTEEEKAAEERGSVRRLRLKKAAEEKSLRLKKAAEEESQEITAPAVLEAEAEAEAKAEARRTLYRSRVQDEADRVDSVEKIRERAMIMEVEAMLRYDSPGSH